MGCWKLGKQDSKTCEQVPEAGALGQSLIISFLLWQVLFGSLKGTRTPRQDRSVLGHLVQQQGIWGTLETLTPWEAGSMEAPHGDK